MSKNWIRKAKLTVSGAAEEIDVSKMRFKFEIYRNVAETPNSGYFRIYNLKAETSKKIVEAKGATVTLEAGYEDNCGQIFKGESVYAINGREDPTDVFTDIFCFDGGSGYQKGEVQKTFDPNSKQEDHFKEIMNSLGGYGIEKGVFEGLKTEKYPKSVTLSGAVKDILRTYANGNNSSWYIDMMKLYHVPVNYADDMTVVLTPNTGLIGMPQETPEGIIITALINPLFKLKTKLKLDEKSINRMPWQLTYEGMVKGMNVGAFLGTKDGEYTINSIEFRGDTRGNDWYAIMYCTGSQTGVNPHVQDLGVQTIR